VTTGPWKNYRAAVHKQSACHLGSAAATNIDGTTKLIIVAENIEALEKAWESLFPMATIKMEHVREVAVFSQKAAKIKEVTP